VFFSTDFSFSDMSHPDMHIVDGQPQSSVGDELYNLTQLAEVSIVYFKHHTAAATAAAAADTFGG